MSASALQVARTGLDAQDKRMQVIANNLANANTTAFKSERANFATLAYQDARVAGQQSSAASNYATGLNLGTGVATQSTTRSDTQGSMTTTGNTLDMAISGQGFFQVAMPDGTLTYTRAGNFSLSAEGQVVTSEGYVVQPPITVPQGASAVTIAKDGSVSAIAAGQSTPSQLGQVNLATFPNPAGLQAASGNYLLETAASGAAALGIPGQSGRGTIDQGMLEASNVDITQQLVDMIECQRAYEINSKMVSAVDDMLKNANQTL